MYLSYFRNVFSASKNTGAPILDSFLKYGPNMALIILQLRLGFGNAKILIYMYQLWPPLHMFTKYINNLCKSRSNFFFTLLATDISFPLPYIQYTTTKA